MTVDKGQGTVKRHLPGIYRNSKVMGDVLAALETEYERLKKEIQITEDTFFVLLAEKHIGRHLDDLGLPCGSDGIAEKRSRVLARLRGMGTVTKTAVKNVANAFVNGQIEVLEFAERYAFGVKFISKKGVPPNLEALQSVIEQIKPAHLAVEYIFTYRVWRDLLNVLGDWQAVKTYTWGGLLEFDVQSFITIVDGKPYFCPDGYGTHILVWENNKPYAREVS